MTVKILIADDCGVIRNSLKALFSGSEIEVVAEASTGTQAVRLALKRTFSLVLLDIDVPDGNGFEALRQIKSAKSELPVLIHSAFDVPHLIDRARDLGAGGWVVKGTLGCDLINSICILARRKCAAPIAAFKRITS